MTDKPGIPEKPENTGLSYSSLLSVAELRGQVKNTVKDIISVLRGRYDGGEKPDDPSIIRKTIDSDKTPEFWKDWRWQLRHAIRDLATVEQVLGIRFTREEREESPENDR